MDYANWSDEVVLSTCVRYGEEARKWRNKFLGMLPEIERRKLYVKKGFSSVFYFAQMVGGVSEAQARQVLQLKEKLEEVPRLQELLTSGAVSMHKLERVASVARVENQEFLAGQVQMLSRRAIDTLVKDIKRSDTKFLSGQESLPSIIPETTQVSVTLNATVAERLQSLENKGIDINQLLAELLDQRERVIKQEKDEIAATCQPTTSRYISKKLGISWKKNMEPSVPSQAARMSQKIFTMNNGTRSRSPMIHTTLLRCVNHIMRSRTRLI